MALLFMDSFDHYVTADITEAKWATNVSSTITADGRRGSNASHGVSSSRTMSRAIPSTSTVILGVAVKMSALGSHVLTVGEASVAHVGVWLAADGSISVDRLSSVGWVSGLQTVLATSAAGLISVGVYAHLQVKVTIADAPGGAVEVRLNGVTVITASGLDTRFGGAGVATLVYIGGTSDLDDLWICDTTGPAPWNDFLGDCRVDARFPSAAGAVTGWTPSTGSNWQCVDEAAPNDDTDYVATATVGATDTLTIQDAPAGDLQVLGVQHCLCVKKSDAGACSIAPVIRQGSTNYVGTAVAPGTTYAYAILAVSSLNPATSTQWTQATFDAAEFGYQRIS